jgi:hypothetical protein
MAAYLTYLPDLASVLSFENVSNIRFLNNPQILMLNIINGINQYAQLNLGSPQSFKPKLQGVYSQN